MYIPPKFQVTEIEKIREFIHSNGFGMLVSVAGGTPQVTHIPMELSENKAGKNVIQGHISRANTQWKSFERKEELLAVFQGAHAYISPTWYARENVPTWNYTAVHVYGKIRILEVDELYQSLKSLVDKYETINESSFRIEHLSPAVLKREMRGIVGFELEINRVEAAYKMSQNRNEFSFNNIVNKLSHKSDTSSQKVAELMKSLCPYKSK